MRLSILNFFSTPFEAIGLAEQCDGLGYHRFWVGEHHSRGQIPDALAFAMVAAGSTARIRLGTGAVSLVFRNPHLIAESAITAELFFPGRIDLGVTKAAAVDSESRARLTAGSDMAWVLEHYPERLRALRDILTREDPAPELFLRESVPLGPAMHVMVTNTERARATGEMGLGLVASFHHGGTEDGIADMVAAYREHFTPSALFAEPSAIVVVSGLVSDALDVRAAAVVAEQELATSAGIFPRSVVVIGAADEAAARIRELGQRTRADEMMFLCLSRGCETCYAELARGWGLTA
ncbi:MAG TPA: LLM class flavin-dependent oxidoreductase [Kofleriaceae bacterium]|nr:LLM class flavin-dependent oxidoreductase [Kofleriaceae bacterium]